MMSLLIFSTISEVLLDGDPILVLRESKKRPGGSKMNKIQIKMKKGKARELRNLLDDYLKNGTEDSIIVTIESASVEVKRG